MAKLSTLTMSVTISGDGTTETWAPAAAPQNTTAPAGGTQSVALSSGPTTITVPSTAKGFVLIPPTTSSNAKTLKGISGDTGVPMARARPTPFLFDETVAPPATIVITAGAGETVDILWL